MKKFILFFLVMITSLISFSQEIRFARANSVLLGSKNFKSEVTWGEAQDCDLLVKIEQSKVTIYSDRPQEYRVINTIEQQEDYSKWLMSDTRGVNCWFYMGVTEDGQYFVGIEYNDYVWFYLITPQD